MKRLGAVCALLVGLLIGLLLTATRAGAAPVGPDGLVARPLTTLPRTLARTLATSLAMGLPQPARGVWPLLPRPAVVAGFQSPASRFGAGHRGADLAGHVGEPVRTALAGRVTYAGRLAGRGVVVVDHGATRTTYEPVAASVHVGATLSAGAVIGRLELVGSHCFPQACLHWGLIEGSDHYLDPLTLVGAAPVRLLPLSSLPAAPVWSVPGVLGSGPRVRLPVGLPEPVGRDVRVQLRGGQ